MKREAALKAAFTKELLSQQPTWLSLLQQTAGAPDRAIVGNSTTSWWEFKHATPDFRSPGLQELMCLRIAQHAPCFYVIWRERADGMGKETCIVLPERVHAVRQRTSGLKSAHLCVPIKSCAGYNMKWLVAQVLDVHIPVI